MMYHYCRSTMPWRIDWTGRRVHFVSRRTARMSTGGPAPKKPRSTTSAVKRRSNKGQKAKKAAKNGGRQKSTSAPAVSERELKKINQAATVAARHTPAARNERALKRANVKDTQ
ncbi:hypothetical protein CAEBREN_18630 [Caenorhabditis brenneri]|uniref:Uncharacterized protein n=1 Tax=Caenorhabditis brenneri TaxID=135651 RepID=G0MM37_CAEBE|nr:hypothetical protein CAEBREN_18630 [Caenorhabditis brenneri]